MVTIKDIRESIKNKTLTEFELQEYVKQFAEKFSELDLGTEIAFKEYARKGAEYLGIDLQDLQAVFSSYRK